MPNGDYRIRGSYRVEADRFAMVPRNDVPRSAFDMRWSHKTTFDAGNLIPAVVFEVLPGDTISLHMTAFCRLATPLVPAMDDLWLESFFFYVPSRLLWSNFERFMGEQLTMTDTTEFILPEVPNTIAAVTPAVIGNLFEYFGVRESPNGTVTRNVCALPFRAYNRIWNDFFRDQDLQNPIPDNTGDGPDSPGDYPLRLRGKRADYFTTARPWPQKPHTGSTTIANLFPVAAGGFRWDRSPGSQPTSPAEYSLAWSQGVGAPVSGFGVTTGTVAGAPNGTTYPGSRVWPAGFAPNQFTTNFRADVDATGLAPNIRVLVNDIRTAEAIQTMLEKNARGGTRYAEIIRSHFGVTSPDFRLQRPEFLGGSRTPVHVAPVAQTSATAGTALLGELGGVGTVQAQGHGFRQSFTEHGYVLGLVNVRANLTYQQNTERMFLRRTKHDFYWPSLAHLGEQAVIRREIYTTGSPTDFDVFGYQERWAEYRSRPSFVTGRFRSGVTNSLDFWHYAQQFSTPPVLNATFIQDNPPVDRNLQVGGANFEQFLADFLFDVRAARCMPMYSIPGLTPRL